MVKHNNQIPNLHYHKKYCESSRGPLKVKIGLNQASRKKTRRIARAAKAAKVAPAPITKLRPIVHCPTQKYSAKQRLGKGFTMEELKAAKLHPSYAQKIGIAIDWRRRNHCEESLERNVARLEAYKKNLVLLKKGDAVPPKEELFGGKVIQPVPPADKTIVTQEVTQEMKDFKAYTTVRVARQETRIAGYRLSVEARKKKE